MVSAESISVVCSWNVCMFANSCTNTALEERRGNQGTEIEVFNEIISMCNIRILSRLRLLKTSRRAGKKSVKEVLQSAVDAIQRNQNVINRKSLSSLAEAFIAKVREVIKLVDAWTNHQIIGRLGNIVDGVFELSKVGRLRGLMDVIPNNDMQPSLRESLLNMISKVSRYRQAARLLYRTAKRFPITRRMKAVVVNLPEEAFKRIPIEDYNPMLQSAVSRISPKHGKEVVFNRIHRLLKNDDVKPTSKFHKQVRKTMAEAKFHAEIQLIYYHELKTSHRTAPRVICSCKDACFLCNCFIGMYGDVYMPRCHGRLYPAWRLPRLPQSRVMEKDFNRVLEIRIRESLQQLLSRGKKVDYPNPCESTLLTLPSSATTVTLSKCQEEKRSDIQSPLKCNIPQKNSSVETHSNGPTPSPLPDQNIRSLSLPKVVANSPDIYMHLNRSIPPSHSTLSSTSTFTDDYHMSQGLALEKHIQANCSSPFYIAGGQLEVQIENSVPSISSTSLPLSYSIEWLTTGDTEKMRDHSLICADTLATSDISYSLDVERTLYIAARGSILKIVFHPPPIDTDLNRVEERE